MNHTDVIQRLLASDTAGNERDDISARNTAMSIGERNAGFAVGKVWAEHHATAPMLRSHAAYSQGWLEAVIAGRDYPKMLAAKLAGFKVCDKLARELREFAMGSDSEAYWNGFSDALVDVWRRYGALVEALRTEPDAAVDGDAALVSRGK